jgi:hypothetical protein
MKCASGRIQAMTYEQAQDALLTLAREHDGLITAADVESDESLAADQLTVSAAARAFAGSTNVFAIPREDDDDGWFPYSEIRITIL